MPRPQVLQLRVPISLSDSLGFGVTGISLGFSSSSFLDSFCPHPLGHLPIKDEEEPDPRVPDPRVLAPKGPNAKVPDPQVPAPQLPDPRVPDPPAPAPNVPEPKVPGPGQETAAADGASENGPD